MITGELCAVQILAHTSVDFARAPRADGLSHRRSGLLLHRAKRRFKLAIEFFFAYFNTVLAEHNTNHIGRHAVSVIHLCKLDHRRAFLRVAVE